MKIIALLFLPVCSFSQIFNTKTDTINFSTKTITIFFDSKKHSGLFETFENKVTEKIFCFESDTKCFFFSTQGSFNETYSKDLSIKELLVVDGKKEILIPKIKEKYFLNDIKEDSKQYFEKGKLTIKLNCLDSVWLISTNNSKEKENNYDSISELKKLIGSYEIEIVNHNRFDYSKNKMKGKLYITNSGITIECPIFVSGLVRSTHLKNTDYYIPTSKSFYCKVNVGDGDNLILNIAEDKSSGSISLQFGKSIQTTSFLIISKL